MKEATEKIIYTIIGIIIGLIILGGLYLILK